MNLIRDLLEEMKRNERECEKCHIYTLEIVRIKDLKDDKLKSVCKHCASWIRGHNMEG
jgi:hypothetical protein